MRTLSRTLIASTAGLAAMAMSASAPVAHGSEGGHDLPGAGGMMAPGMMGELGADLMDMMRGLRSHDSSGHPRSMAPATPEMPGMPDQHMDRRAIGPDMPEMPQMPAMPGDEGVPGMRGPSFQLQMAPGWSG